MAETWPQQGYDKKVALVLQGGGALGSYQAGVYEALCRSPWQPDWVAGISIGAINAAIIAGNARERRVERLREFWEGVTAPSSSWPVLPGPFREAQRQAGALSALLFGQPGFFAPVSPLAWLAGGATSYYATSALKSTLERLVDFDRINAGETRLSVGAVNVRNGHFSYFDSLHIKIRPEHVMASGALPPGFPAVEIDGEHYWDGGLVSNTPLSYVMESLPRRSRLIFQVDLFPARGREPATIEEASEREKDIRYSSRTRLVTETFRQFHELRYNINELWEKLPPELQMHPAAQYLYTFSCPTRMDIVQLIYRPHDPQGSSKDFEFSRSTMEGRWAQGQADAALTLEASPWLSPPPAHVGVRSFDVVHDRRTAKSARSVAAEAERSQPGYVSHTITHAAS
jgi:NTE family protein